MPGVVTAGRLVDDRYRLLEALEEGGMGILWRAEDLITERYVTVKELRFPDPLDHMQRRALAARVRREARAMAAVDHPGLARIVDVVDDGDRPWVVTELVEAPTLADLVSRGGPMEPERVALLGIRLLDVLQAAGDEDMVHRFLQPSKVFVSASGEVRVADFGIASLIGDPTVASTGAVGGVSFMAPEQAGTPEADIWSLGAVLYYAVEGVAPFEGANSTAILAAIADDAPRPPAHAGPLARALELALHKDPSERPSADELRSVLEVAAGPLAPRPEPEPAEDAIVWADLAADEGTASDVPLAWPEDVPAHGDGIQDGASADGEAGHGRAPAEPADGDVEVGHVEVGHVGSGDVGSGDVGSGDVEGGGVMVEVDPAPSPPRLEPREALARMFSPDPGSPPTYLPVEDEHRQPPPPWPVAHKRGLWSIAICGLVMLVLVLIMITNGREIFSNRTHSARTIAAVKWAQYNDPATGFRIDYPADWTVTREGIYTDFRHPDSAAALRVVAQPSTAASAEAGWIELEKRFSTEQPTYRRVRLEPKEFRKLDAAEWEFIYSKANVDLHNIDLGVVTGEHSYALNFETRASNWTAVRPLFERFESSFRPAQT